MNRKSLAVLTLCILALGLTIVRAQSPAQSPGQSSEQSQPQAPAAEESDHVEWIAADPLMVEPFDVFTSPLEQGAAAGLPFPDPAGDVFFYTAGAELDMAFAEPVEFAAFTAALPFPGPDQQGAIAGGVAFTGPDPQDTITFVGFEAGLGNQSVTGAPYSAQITSEFVQPLSDGNKIERKTTTTVYRDGQGRTRREQSLPAIGQYSAGSQPPQAIFINDPVAGVSYVLDPARKTARKMTRPNIRVLQGNANGGPGRGAIAVSPGPGGPGPDGPGGRGRGPGGNPPPAQGGIAIQRAERRQDANVTTESLGSQNIEGILVQGTRVTRTIPAGTVGNQSPIRVTSERWYSPDLQLNLLVKNIDPMRGTNSTTLTSIRRDEPSASLFQVPADYTVQEPPNRMMMRGQRIGPPPAPQQ